MSSPERCQGVRVSELAVQKRALPDFALHRRLTPTAESAPTESANLPRRLRT